MLKDIVYFVASLFIFGMVYWIIDLIFKVLKIIIPMSEPIELAVLFLWSLVPAIYFVGKARQLFESRKVTRLE